MGHDWPDAPVAVLAMTGASILFLYGNDQTVTVFAVKSYELNIQAGCNVMLLMYLFDKPDE